MPRVRQCKWAVIVSFSVSVQHLCYSHSLAHSSIFTMEVLRLLLVSCATDKLRVVTGAMNDSFVLSQSHTLTNDLHSDFRSFLSCLKNNQASCGFARITTLDSASDQRQLEAASATFLFGKASHHCTSPPNIILFERILIPLKDNLAHIQIPRQGRFSIVVWARDPGAASNLYTV